jgi:hypothetical protein
MYVQEVCVLLWTSQPKASRHINKLVLSNFHLDNDLYVAELLLYDMVGVSEDSSSSLMWYVTNSE